MTRKKLLIAILGLVVLGSICWAIWWFQSPETLNDLAYDVNKCFGYTVYLPEGDELIPYYVLTYDYNGHCLLLRKHLLNELRVFNYPYPPVKNYEDYIPPAYYENSDIDRFLCGEFLETLSALDDRIVDTDLIITHRKSIGVTGKETTTIQRKAFLLSHAEITGQKQSVPATEGVGLACFERHNRDGHRMLIGTTVYDQTFGWWLRTPDNWYTILVYGVTDTGGVTSFTTRLTTPTEIRTNGVRPALCLPRDTVIVEDTLDWRRIYKVVLDATSDE